MRKGRDAGLARAEAGFETCGEFGAVEVAPDENQGVAAGTRAPGTAFGCFDDHVHSLKDDAMSDPADGEDSFHAKDVGAFGLGDFGQPALEFRAIAVALSFQPHAGDRVVMVVMVGQSVIVRLALIVFVMVVFMGVVAVRLPVEKVGINFRGVVEVEAAKGEEFGHGNFGPNGADDGGQRIHGAEAALQGGGFLFGDEIAFVENDPVGEGDLLLHFRTVFQMEVGMFGIDQGDDSVDEEFLSHFGIHEKGLHDGAGIGQAGGFDQDVIEAIAAAGELFEDADEVPAHGAANAAVIHLEDLFVGLQDQFVIHADFPEFIFNDGQPQAVIFAEDAVEKGRFAGPKIAGQDGYGDRIGIIGSTHFLGGCFFVRVLENCKKVAILGPMTPLAVFVGFLGAGKTTALRRLLPELVARECVPTVILNDYQNARVDAEYFREISAAVTPISGSCVCCGSRQELLEALERVEPVPGGVVLLETNGTTDAGELVTVLATDPKLRQYTLPLQVSLIDVRRWQKRFWHNRLEIEQVRTASTLWLTHADEVSAERKQAVVESLQKNHLWQEETDAEKLAVELARLVAEVADQPVRPLGCGGCEHDHDHDHDHEPDHAGGHGSDHDSGEGHDHQHAHAVRHHFAATEVALPELVSRELFLEALRELPPEILRVKGLVRLAEEPESLQIFQKVEQFHNVQIAPLAGEPLLPGPVAVLIGSHFPEGCVEEFRERLAARAV